MRSDYRRVGRGVRAADMQVAMRDRRTPRCCLFQFMGLAIVDMSA